MMEQHAGRTILVIDDEVNARKLAKMLLEREGFTVFTAGNGEEGLTLAKVERPDVILLDLIMPKMSGHEVLQRLKQDPDTRAISIIVLTAKVADRDIATSFRLGAAFHLEKPYEVKDLIQKIYAALALGRQEGSV
ncbi:MAG: response regulator [Candidatus Omnitrophica bacterium]|nr:response regulator [Candidatus Omnitrophota bacterium]